jgi:hypothetical protein
LLSDKTSRTEDANIPVDDLEFQLRRFRKGRINFENFSRGIFSEKFCHEDFQVFGIFWIRAVVPGPREESVERVRSQNNRPGIREIKISGREIFFRKFGVKISIERGPP